jgi:hypothetical protein
MVIDRRLGVPASAAIAAEHDRKNRHIIEHSAGQPEG